MAVKVDVPYQRSFTVAREPEFVFAYFKDVTKAVPENFPGVEEFQPIGTDRYRWVFEKIGYSSYELRIRLATQFQFDAPKRITAIPIPEPDGCLFTGSWDFTAEGSGTKVTFDAKFEIELPIPGFLKSMAAPIAQTELKKLFDRYIDRVEKNLAK